MEMGEALERKRMELEEQLMATRQLQDMLQEEKGAIDYEEIARLREFERSVLSEMRCVSSLSLSLSLSRPHVVPSDLGALVSLPMHHRSAGVQEVHGCLSLCDKQPT